MSNQQSETTSTRHPAGFFVKWFQPSLHSRAWMDHRSVIDGAVCFEPYHYLSTQELREILATADELNCNVDISIFADRPNALRIKYWRDDG